MGMQCKLLNIDNFLNNIWKGYGQLFQRYLDESVFDMYKHVSFMTNTFGSYHFNANRTKTRNHDKEFSIRCKE